MTETLGCCVSCLTQLPWMRRAQMNSTASTSFISHESVKVVSCNARTVNTNCKAVNWRQVSLDWAHKLYVTVIQYSGAALHLMVFRCSALCKFDPMQSTVEWTLRACDSSACGITICQALLFVVMEKEKTHCICRSTPLFCSVVMPPSRAINILIHLHNIKFDFSGTVIGKPRLPSPPSSLRHTIALPTEHQPSCNEWVRLNWLCEIFDSYEMFCLFAFFAIHTIVDQPLACHK